MNFRREMAAALREDRAHRDVTARLFVPATARARARLIAQAPGVLAGGGAAAEAFRLMGGGVAARACLREGAPFRSGGVVVEARGPLRSLLSAERTALNTLCHLSGIATVTASFVRAAGPGGPKILDTRKTLPGLRDLEKHAVRCGGGESHRRDLSAAVLIKENHLAFYDTPARRVDFIKRVTHARRGGRFVEMECRNRDEALLGIKSRADILLLDNIPLPRLPTLVRWIRNECARLNRPSPLLEVSGGVTLDKMPHLVRAGIDRVSIGRLTHSAPSLPMHMDVTLL